MAITLNNATVGADGYVNAQTTEDAQADGQAAAAANAASQAVAHTKLLVAQAADGSDVPGATVGGVSAGAASSHQGQQLHSSVPNLPYQQIAKADAPTGKQIVSVLADMNLSSVTAYRILQQAGQKAFDLDSTISIASNRAVTSAKLQQVKDLKAQIDGERHSANTQLAFAIVGAGAGIGMGVYGNLLRGATASKNTAIDYDRKLTGINTVDSKNGDETIKEFLNGYNDKHADLLKEHKTAANNPTGSLKPEHGLPFEDKSYREFAAYKKRMEVSGSIPKDLEGKDRDLHIGKEWFAARAGGRNFEGISAPGSTMFERIAHHKDGKSSIGAGIDGGAQGMQSVVTQLGTAYDTLHGGKYDADQAKLAQKQDEVQVSLAQQVADQAKSNKDRDLKQISDNLDAIKEVAARYASVIDKLT